MPDGSSAASALRQPPILMEYFSHFSVTSMNHTLTQLHEEGCCEMNARCGYFRLGSNTMLLRGLRLGKAALFFCRIRAHPEPREQGQFI